MKNNIDKVLKEGEASQEYIINKPLKLQTVNPGSNEDDLLVRGADNTVKFVPQNAINTPTLQNVLTAQNYAEDLDLRLFSNSYDDYTTLSYNGQIEMGNLTEGQQYIGKFFSTGLQFQEYGDLGQYRVTLEAPINKPFGNNYVSYYFPEKTNGEYTLAITADLPVSGSYDASINDKSTNVNNPGNTFIEKIYYTKTDKNVYCSASVSIETNADTSSDIAFIQVSLPFPQSSTFPRLNAGNGTLHGGGLGNLFVPAIVQLEGTNNAKIIFAGKSGDSGSSYQGEIHWTYETD